VKTFRVVSVNLSEHKGEKKVPKATLLLRENHGVEGDAHAGPWHRQVSLLASEDIAAMEAKGTQIAFGDFAENITTRGIDLASLPIGAHLKIGDAELEITQIGKECHQGCAIRQQLGDCIMPRRGVFARVITGGVVGNESPGSYDF
jgi:MOSC domain-containing protein YiiM